MPQLAEVNNTVKREHKAFLGLVIVLGILLGYAFFAGALKTHGILVWIGAGIFVAGNIAAAIKFPQYRRWLGIGVKYGFEAVADYFTGNSRAGSERKAVPRPIQRRVVARANARCQYPRCQETGRARLDMHHIDMNPANSHDEENLILLCPNHHRQIHSDSDISTRQVRSWIRRPTRSAVRRS